MKPLPLPPSLQGRVASVLVVENIDQESTVLPSTGAVLGLQTRGCIRSDRGMLTTAGITGIQRTSRRYTYVGDTASLLVRFTPQGAACFGVPVSELSERNVSLADVLPAASVRELQERVHEQRSDRERLAVVEQFLLKLPYAEDPIVGRAIELMEAGDGEPLSVASLARSLGLSERQFERRFLQRVGIGPKRFAALRRFERAVALAKTAPSLTEVAFEAGYYDQSHFIRDFHRFTGQAPGAVLKSPA